MKTCRVDAKDTPSAHSTAKCLCSFHYSIFENLHFIWTFHDKQWSEIFRQCKNNAWFRLNQAPACDGRFACVLTWSCGRREVEQSLPWSRRCGVWLRASVINVGGRWRGFSRHVGGGGWRSWRLDWNGSNFLGDVIWNLSAITIPCYKDSAGGWVCVCVGGGRDPMLDFFY